MDEQVAEFKRRIAELAGEVIEPKVKAQPDPEPEPEPEPVSAEVKSTTTPTDVVMQDDDAPPPGAVTVTVSVPDWREMAKTVPMKKVVVRDSATGRVQEIVEVPDTKGAIAPHNTTVVDETWDAAPVIAALTEDGQANWRSVFAWLDPAASDDDGDGYPDAKDAWSLPHHTRIGGPAVVAAVRDSLAQLSKSNIPQSDISGIQAHLNRHIDAWNNANP